MIDTKNTERPRGRPRSFDVEGALATAQRLFHERGYDGVSLANLTQALGINPPSFYAAFGSKAELFDRILARYAAEALPLDCILREGRPVPEALADLLSTAAGIYATDRAEAGCLVIEATRTVAATDCSAKAQQYRLATHAKIRDFIAHDQPLLADRLADFIDITLSGMSASAREGWDRARLQEVAKMASLAIQSACLAERK